MLTSQQCKPGWAPSKEPPTTTSNTSTFSLVLAAAEPWGPRTHALFPAAARGFAVELLLLGHQLSRQPRFAGEEVSLVDVWTELVMPSAIVR